MKSKAPNSAVADLTGAIDLHFSDISQCFSGTQQESARNQIGTRSVFARVLLGICLVACSVHSELRFVHDDLCG